jgi:16S rRNA (guanine(966)-N(2))-methyltransferase RsmD
MAIFSSLQFELEGRRVLDLFAGSGQMGLEAVSRGADHAVLVDQSKDAVKIIQKNAEKTRLAEDCTIICSDFAEFLRQRRGREPFDIVFIDPPYAMKACKAAVEAILENRLLTPHGVLVLESAEADPLGTGTPLSERFEVLKSAKYGVAYVHILTPKA